jgi:hypothetical protein
MAALLRLLRQCTCQPRDAKILRTIRIFTKQGKMDWQRVKRVAVRAYVKRVNFRGTNGVRLVGHPTQMATGCRLRNKDADQLVTILGVQDQWEHTAVIAHPARLLRRLLL